MCAWNIKLILDNNHRKNIYNAWSRFYHLRWYQNIDESQERHKVCMSCLNWKGAKHVETIKFFLLSSHLFSHWIVNGNFNTDKTKKSLKGWGWIFNFNLHPTKNHMHLASHVSRYFLINVRLSNDTMRKNKFLKY